MFKSNVQNAIDNVSYMYENVNILFDLQNFIVNFEIHL